MSRRRCLAVSWAALASTACGCLSKTSNLADLPPLPAPPVAVSPEVTRAQKPDSFNPSNTAVCRLLTLPVDRPAEVEHANPAATIRAVVNGELILDEEVVLSCVAQLRAARTPQEHKEIIKQAVEVLIDREVVLQDAFGKMKRGGKQGEAFLKEIQKITDQEFDKRWMRPTMKDKHINSRAELAALMRQSGMSLETFCRWWERNYMCQQFLTAHVEPLITRIGHTEISEYYNSHSDEYTQPDSVDWQDIFLNAGRHASRAAARQFAEALVQRVRQGEDFANLSVEFDDGESGHFRKGAGHGHKRGEIFPPEAEPMLFQMHEGDMEIIECSHGFHIVRLIKRQYAGLIPFDAKVQKEIRDKLRNIVFMREKESVIKDLRRKAVIDRCD
ncbi:MAG TPA: peptidyl-prolyl cis-trans isomerase [Gemmataceae bacterium]|nr:peptidyl-prolyl cis-trans isomerase [Gemmataceae bacterium]